MLEKLERLDEAIVVYDKIIFLRFGNYEIWLKRGLILERLGYV